MRKVFSFLKNPKVIATAAVLTIVGAVTATAFAWGPNRPTYTIANPADHVTFNSITDNPNYGDERTFFDGKSASNTASGGFSGNVQVQDGEEILLRTYVHNNASASLNGKNYDGKGVAKNTKVRIQLPTATAQALRVGSFISADNAAPGTVYDNLDLNGSKAFSVSYVPGSAIQYTNAVPSGMKLSDSIVTTGAPIGYTAPNGIVPGCFEYSGIVTIKVKVHMPKYQLTKQVRPAGTKSGGWVKDLATKPGDTVEYSLGFKNTGSTKLNNVVIGDKLPAHMSIVPGSTEIVNSSNPNGVNAGSDNIVKGGIDIGNYNAGANAYVYFKAKVADVDKLGCGTNTLTNTGYAKPEDQGTVNDTANVTVNKECEEVPSYSCDLLKATLVGKNTYKFTVDTSAQNAKVVDYSFDFGDKSEVVKTDKNTVTHTYKPGTYQASVKVGFEVNGDYKQVSSAACATTINTEKPPVTPPTPTTPVTPPITGLPATGAGSVVGGAIGISAIAYGAYSLIESRRALRNL